MAEKDQSRPTRSVQRHSPRAPHEPPSRLRTSSGSGFGEPSHLVRDSAGAGNLPHSYDSPLDPRRKQVLASSTNTPNGDTRASIPRLTPRGPTVGKARWQEGRASAERGRDDEGKDDLESFFRGAPWQDNRQVKNTRRMSLLDFLDSEDVPAPPGEPSAPMLQGERRAPAHTPLRVRAASAQESSAAEPRLPALGRSSLRPREATTGPPSFEVRTPSIWAKNTQSNDHTACAVSDNSPLSSSPGEARTTGMTAWEFLSAEPPSSVAAGKQRSANNKASPGQPAKAPRNKGKQRAEVPTVQLRVLPTSDVVNMFGSTQTSSNYSLSGKVVVSVQGQQREAPLPAQAQSVANTRPQKTQDQEIISDIVGTTGGTSRSWLPEIRANKSTFLDADEFLRTRFSRDADRSDESEIPNGAEEISIQSLQVTFQGYALYVDHTGRFTACKLVEVTENILSQDSIVAVPPEGREQEYDIEYNLSVPGWLPGTLFTRFGGTFYSLEASARYSAIERGREQHAIPSTLVPPRRGSMVPLDDNSDGAVGSETQGEVASAYYPGSPMNGTDGEDGKPIDHLQTPKARIVSLSSDSQEKGKERDKETWLSKRAKRLSGRARVSSQTMSRSTSASESATGPSTSSSNESSLSSHLPPKLFASRGYINAYSDSIVIVIRRCREVVPVPVARMALTGPGGTPDGVVQDPPPPSQSQATSSGAGAQVVAALPSPHPSLHSPSQPSPRLPSALDAPTDPAKLAAHVAAQTRLQMPQRSSSVSQELSALEAQPAGSASNGASGGQTSGESSSAIPMRHFLHRPLLHPPSDAGIPGAESGLPFSLTLSLPSHVAVDGPGSETLSFAIQIEVGQSSLWSDVRRLGGLRLREMELSCIQTERHCSVASRTFCHAYPLPPDCCNVRPYDLPVFTDPATVMAASRSLNSTEQRLRRGYNRELVIRHIEMTHAGQAPDPEQNNVERVRTVAVGPPPRQKSNVSESDNAQRIGTGPGKNEHTNLSDGQPRAMIHNESAPAGLQSINTTGPTSSEREDSPTETRNGGSGRRRRAYQSAIRSLSTFATAVMTDGEGANQSPTSADPRRNFADTSPNADDVDGSGRNRRRHRHADVPKDASRAALYTFSGNDGHGVDLTRGRVRMAIKLPLVTSSASQARVANSPQLLPDFESPFTKTRHKLQVKLGFGFGNKPLGGEGNWGQSLVMCVPVRFTEAAPREVREQFAPLPIRQVSLPARPNGDNAGAHDAMEGPSELQAADAAGKVSASTMLASLDNTSTQVSDAPILPSYNQLFREDGSRLADDGEDLPQYPGPRIMLPHRGSVSAFSPRDMRRDPNATPRAGFARLDSGQSTNSAASAGLTHSSPADTSESTRAEGASSRLHQQANVLSVFDNRIAPMRVLDESIPKDARGEAYRAQQRREMEELQQDVRKEDMQRARRFSSAARLRPAFDEASAGEGDTAGSAGGAATASASNRSQQDDDDDFTDYEQNGVAISGGEEDADEVAALPSQLSTNLGETVDVDASGVFSEDMGDDMPFFAAPRPLSGATSPSLAPHVDMPDHSDSAAGHFASSNINGTNYP